VGIPTQGCQLSLFFCWIFLSNIHLVTQLMHGQEMQYALIVGSGICIFAAQSALWRRSTTSATEEHDYDGCAEKRPMILRKTPQKHTLTNDQSSKKHNLWA
jgi:hypothetical protein